MYTHQTYGEPKAAFRLVLPDLGHAGLIQAPDVHFPVDATASQITAIRTQRNGPDISRLNLVCPTLAYFSRLHYCPSFPQTNTEQGIHTTDLSIQLPLSILPFTPHLDFPLKPRTCRALRLFRCDEVVDTQRVHAFERLYEREVGGCGAMNLDGRGAAGGEEGCGCRGEGEYIGGMGVGEGVEG